MFSLAVAGAFALDAIESRDDAIETARHMTHDVAELLAEHASQTFQGAEQSLKAMVHAHDDWAEDLDSDPAQGQRILRSIQSGSASISAMAWIDKRGVLAAGTADLPKGQTFSFAERPAFYVHRYSADVGLYLEEPRRQAITDRWTSTISRRLEDRGGQFAGVALARVDLDYFSDHFYSVAYARGLTVALLQSDGTILAHHPSRDLYIGTALAGRGDRFWQELQRSRSGSFEDVRADGGGVDIVGYQRVRAQQMVVTVSVPRSTALAPWYARLRITGSLAILAIFGAIAATGVIWWKTRALEREKDTALEARLAAEEANRSKSEFLAHMSHELRTPLNAILGFSEMITRETFGPVGSPKYREYVHDIRHSGQHLLQVINNILDLAKVEAGKWTLDEAPCAPRELAADVLAMLRERARSNGVALALAPAGPDVTLRADPRIVRQILLNLAVNGIKFTERGGRVGIEWCVTADGRLALAVSDTGCGMTSEDMKRVIEPFGRGTAMRARKQHDTGLGLPLCKRFTELHGGELVIESAPGKGTRITALFPADRVIETRARQIAEAAA